MDAILFAPRIAEVARSFPSEAESTNAVGLVYAARMVNRYGLPDGAEIGLLNHIERSVADYARKAVAR